MNDGTYDGPNRRDGDTVISMLREQISSTHTALQDHVQGCSQMQKRVLIVVALIFIWLVAHSPEAARLVAKAFPSFGGP